MSNLLTVNEVAEYLRTTTNTIYRWLREGKLSAIKIGKEWRIDQSSLRELLTQQTSTANADLFYTKFNQNEHLMVITNSKNEIFELEASFFKHALQKGARVFKGCWLQEEDEVREKFAQFGLDTYSLEKEGLLSLVSFSTLYQKHGIDGPVNAWSQAIDKTVSLGLPKLWASGSPHVLVCNNGYNEILSFEAKLNQTIKTMPVIGICPYCINEFSGDHFSNMITLMQHHSGTAFYSNGQFTLLRN